MQSPESVRIWTEDLVIPTYRAGEPNANPMFLEKRVYQGSSGRVYPYAVIDKICDEKSDETHTAIFLENEYLKLMVMPGFGGRIQSAYDKTNDYAFIYHNRVIKPALVGLAGPWLSGGIEFNWPQHHRPGTYCPVEHATTWNADGSQTLWLSELEPMWGLKSTLGLTLYPARALLEINLRLCNPTSLPQSFHLWTNPAVHVNDRYQSVFPPDVQAVYDHGKRDVSSFPVARGEYYKVDYSRGVDISWYKNLPVPTSFMAAHSDYNFIGGYDHGRQAGVLHVADHHVVPGKKQWVWGCGEFGRAWDRNLTDEDGPYAELMCGVFADNQPDFSWLEPGEEKEVRQFFLPYKTIGLVRNATIDAAVSLEHANGQVSLGAYATASRPRASIRLVSGHKIVWQTIQDLAPDRPFTAEVKLPRKLGNADLELSVHSREGALLVAYAPEPVQAAAIPQPAKPIPRPDQVETTEALYLAGLHLEQYRHATREPEDYYREGLRRDPGDVRSNNALGLLLLRRGQFSLAEPLFRAAIRTQTRHNPNPQDGEPHYNLGVCLRHLARSAASRAEASDRLSLAYDAFYKATWNAAWQDAAFFQLAQIASARGDFAQALDFIERSRARNAHNQKARHLEIVLLRKLGRSVEAQARAEAALARDPLDFAARNELNLLHTPPDGQKAERPIPRPPRTAEACARDGDTPLGGPGIHAGLELAADYAQAGAYEEAIALLQSLVAGRGGARAPRRGGAPPAVPAPGHLGETSMPNAWPMVFYFLGSYATQFADANAAARYFRLAAAQSPDRCFPNSLDALGALQAALRFNPKDARAALYLGNLWYDKRQVKEAIACWEAARQADPALPVVHRNLALAYFNKLHDPSRALRSLQTAFRLDPSDARVLFELDLLKRRAGVAPEKRMAFLAKHLPTVHQREDLLLEFITLLNLFGRHEEALDRLLSRTFHPWEGGEGRVTGQYVTSLVEMAKDRMLAGGQAAAGAAPAQNAARLALDLLERARHYPESLGEGKLHGARENPIHFWLGKAHEQRGDAKAARTAWRLAATGMSAPTPAVYYNDQNPETIFYQGLALAKLGRASAARERFQTLVTFGKGHLKDRVEIDYFAVSLPEFMVFDDDLDRRNQINCRYLLALGLFGLRRAKPAREQLRQVLALDPAHLGARLHSKLFQLAAPESLGL